MSTGLECEIIEEAEGVWWYVLMNWDCPRGAWDWREYADAYGPFKTQDEAVDHLRDNHANPGGYSVGSYSNGSFTPDDTFANLKAEAAKRKVERPAPFRSTFRPYW